MTSVYTTPPSNRYHPLSPAAPPEIATQFFHTCTISLFHSHTLPRDSPKKSHPLTPFLSAAPLHSFHSFPTLFRVTRLFATLTKNNPGYTPPAQFLPFWNRSAALSLLFAFFSFAFRRTRHAFASTRKLYFPLTLVRDSLSVAQTNLRFPFVSPVLLACAILRSCSDETL